MGCGEGGEYHYGAYHFLSSDGQVMSTGYGSYGGYNNYGGHFSYTATTTTYNAADAYLARLASQQRFADFCQALQESRQVIEQDYLKKTTIYPGESVSGFVHVASLVSR